MPVTSTHPKYIESQRWWLAALGLSLVWAVPIWHFSLEWNLNPQYHYGWLVPFLCLYLVRLRMPDLPLPAIPWSDDAKKAKALMAAAVGCYLPLLVIRVGNPDWRPLGYVIAGQAVVLTMLAIYVAAGWRAAWHLLFPVAFFMVAVPWPRPVDAPLMDTLMSGNAGVAVEGLLWQGIAASRKGNLIILPSGTVGVDEACSGIRSLQGTLMLAIFLGELKRLGILSRVLLVLLGVVVALFTNSVRTFFLARVAAFSGAEAIDSWHDSAGYLILLANFVLLLAVSSMMRAPRRIKASRSNSWWANWAIYRGVPAGRWTCPPAWWSWGVLLTIAGSWGFTSWWYARGDKASRDVISWQLEAPDERSDFKRQRISDKVLITLRYDQGWTGRWSGSRNSEFQAWYLQWKPGRNGAQLASLHDPRICLGGLGLEMQAELGRWKFQKGALALPVETFRFRDGNQVVHVYYILRDDLSAEAQMRRFDNSTISRLRAAWEGVRNRGQRLVELGLWGDFEEAEARDMAEQFFAEHVVVNEPVNSRPADAG